MKINKRFLHFKTLAGFQDALSQGIISRQSIVFIADRHLIWTHGEYYGGGDLPEDWQFGDAFPVALQ